MPLVPLQGKSRKTQRLGGAAVKQYRNLYEKIYDFENLYIAYLKARKCKRYRDEVLLFTANLEENLIGIQNDLIYQSYQVGRYHEFFEYDPKKRLIMALPFRDRVVQWAIYQIVNPLFMQSYISDSYASIPGRGTQAAIQRLQYWLRLINSKSEKFYVLKMDIAKFFFRVPHDVQLRLLAKKVDDQRLMWLFGTIINSEDVAFGLPIGVTDIENCDRLFDIGMPVGNLLSQMLANIVMNEPDQYCKRKLKIHYYMRYMDDMLILSSDKKLLHQYQEQIEIFLGDHLGLVLNNKTSIQPVTLGIDFVGYKIWHDHIRLKKKTSLRMKRRLRSLQKQYACGIISFEKVREVVSSYQGLLSHCDSYLLRREIFGEHTDRERFPGWFKLQRNEKFTESKNE